MSKKRYYSPVKSYDTYKRPHIFYKMLTGILKIFFPKNEFIWTGEKPKEGEAYVYVGNHTKIYAPVYFLVQHKEKVRLWANCDYLYFGMCWKIMKNKVLKNREPKFLLYPLAWLLTPLIVFTFRAICPVPVFHKCERTKSVTFHKAMETFEEGLPMVVFPERTVNKVNKYVFQFRHGFPEIAKEYYEKTGKKVKFYPVYCAQNLRKFVVGNPIEYNPEEDISTQRDKVTIYLQNEIERVGNSLPEHEPVLYG